MDFAMQDWPMRVSRIIDHAARNHGQRELIARTVEGPIERTTWGAVRDGALRVAQALARDGIRPGDVIGVMAWNTARHLEVWYGVSGAGAVLHTLNPRLFAGQLDYIINHAEDRFLFVDFDLVPVLENIRDKLGRVEKVVVMTDDAHMPETPLPGAVSYQQFLDGADGDFDWTPGEETDPCGICYTSGTTGHPKGVVYTHRSNMIHAMACVAPDLLGLSCRDVVMPVVPLFHANGWSLGYSSPMAGASMVMPGRGMTAPLLYEMLEQGVTYTAAVPTIWLGLLQHMEENGLKLSTLKRVVIGGSSCPRAVIETFQDVYGVQVIHAWGMTETSPLGTTGTFTPEVAAMDREARLDMQTSVGHAPFTVELRITDDAGAELPHDGKTQGKLWIRGPGVVKRYLKAGEDAVGPDDWFDTGDVATIDSLGYVRITDRSKDVIKSGGEWISSIDLENAAVAHPEVAEAAAVGVPHPKWSERPVLFVVPKAGRNPTRESILQHVGRDFAKWQVPDDVIFVNEIPHTATGKISKLALREKLSKMEYRLPEK